MGRLCGEVGGDIAKSKGHESSVVLGAVAPGKVNDPHNAVIIASGEK